MREPDSKRSIVVTQEFGAHDGSRDCYEEQGGRMFTVSAEVADEAHGDRGVDEKHKRD